MLNQILISFFCGETFIMFEICQEKENHLIIHVDSTTKTKIVRTRKQ